MLKYNYYDSSLIKNPPVKNVTFLPYYLKTSGGGLLAAGFAFGAAVGSLIHVLNQVIDHYCVICYFGMYMKFLTNVMVTLGIIIEYKCRSIIRTYIC